MKQIYIIGMGPGKYDQMTVEAIKKIEESDIVIGYTVYTDLIKEKKELPIQIISNLFEQKTTTGAVNIIKDNNFDNCFDILADQMLYYSYNRAFKAEIFYHKNRYANIEEFKNNLAIRIIVFSDNIMIIDTGENNE